MHNNTSTMIVVVVVVLVVVVVVVIVVVVVVRLLRGSGFDEVRHTRRAATPWRCHECFDERTLFYMI